MWRSSLFTTLNFLLYLSFYKNKSSLCFHFDIYTESSGVETIFTKILFIFFQIIGVHFDKKIQFESLYFNVLCLIQCVTCHFYVIICEIY